MRGTRSRALAILLLACAAAAACHRNDTARYSLSFNVAKLPPKPPSAESAGAVLSEIRAESPGPYEPRGAIPVRAAGKEGLAVIARLEPSGKPVLLTESPGSPGTYSGEIPLEGVSPGTYSLVAETGGSQTPARVSAAGAVRVVSSLMQEKVKALNAKLQPVYFAVSEWSIDASALEAIRTDAGILAGAGAFEAFVQGNADETGTEEHNRWLGLWRAKEVKDTLRSLGLDPDRLTIQSLGSSHPAVEGHDPASLAKNRRVEIVVQRQR